MKYAKVNLFDVANGNGIRVSLFVSGCKFHCPGCFNPEAQDFNYGKEYTQEIEDVILHTLTDCRYEGLSLLGGDPLWQSDEDIDKLIAIVDKVHTLRKNVWIWTGFYKEDLNEKQRELLDKCDVVIDGPFEIEKRDLSLAWRGSTNQRIICQN